MCRYSGRDTDAFDRDTFGPVKYYVLYPNQYKSLLVTAGQVHITRDEVYQKVSLTFFLGVLLKVSDQNFFLQVQCIYTGYIIGQVGVRQIVVVM